MDALTSLESIEAVKKQLEEVTSLLNSATGEDRKRLEEVQLDLLNILELTVLQLEAENVQLLNKSTTNIDEEFALFKAEIEKVTSENEEKSEEIKDNFNENNTNESGSLINDLLALEGTEIRAPFTERWGGHSYHNAVILSVVLSNEDLPLQNPKAVVLYSQPTSNAMVPCRFYLEEKCKFSREKCKYSHGNEVDVASLKDYVLPDIQSMKKGSRVISKHDGELWHRGIVYDELSDRSLFSVNCEVCNSVVEVQPQNMVPIMEGEIVNQNLTAKQIHTEPHNEDGDPTEIVSYRLLNPNSDFAEWEKHTKGIGSKLMSQMGYVPGTGLGCRSDGRIDPVTTLVYPQGVSLDRCMELRTAGEGRCLLDVEKHLQKQQKKADAQLKRQEENIRNDNVFDIINNKLSRKPGESSDGRRKMDVSKSSLQKHTVKDLNRKNMELGSYIQNVSNEINKLEESKKRHVNDKQTVDAISGKLLEKRSKLNSLRQAEQAVRKEQINRKDAKKISIF